MSHGIFKTSQKLSVIVLNGSDQMNKVLNNIGSRYELKQYKAILVLFTQNIESHEVAR